MKASARKMILTIRGTIVAVEVEAYFSGEMTHER